MAPESPSRAERSFQPPLATGAAVRSSAGASLLHLATHAGQGPGGPWLALSDGRLTAADVVSARLGPRLVVMATCASATPRGRSLWGGLAAAFRCLRIPGRRGV